MEDYINMEVVPLRPQECRRCGVTRPSMEFYKKDKVCKFCTQKVRDEYNRKHSATGYSIGFGGSAFWKKKRRPEAKG